MREQIVLLAFLPQRGHKKREQSEGEKAKEGERRGRGEHERERVQWGKRERKPGREKEWGRGRVKTSRKGTGK